MILEAIINAKKIKYSVLKPLVEQSLPAGTKELNVFISLECVLKQFYRTDVNERINSLERDEKYLLSSEIINVVAHYRHFFWSRYGMPTTYFVYYSSRRPSFNVKTVPDYRRSFYEKRSTENPEYGPLNAMIEENMGLANMLSEYLPNIYFVDTGGLAPSALPDFIISKNQDEGLSSLVLSNNPADYQMVNNGSTVAITLNSDNSRAVTRENLMGRLLKGSKTKSDTILDPQMYVPVLSVAGLKAFDLPSVKGMGNLKTVKALEAAVEAGDIANGRYDDVSPIADLFPGDAARIKSNFSVLDYRGLHERMTPKQFDRIRRQIENKSDNQSLMEINHEYYEKYPLQLIELCEGEG